MIPGWSLVGRVLLPLVTVGGLTLISALAYPGVPPQEPGILQFQIGESLRYSIYVWGFPAGSATMRVDDSVSSHGQPTLRLLTTAKSNDFVSLFYPVNNLVDETIHPETLLPFHFIFHRREGRRHDDYDVTFDYENMVVTTVKNGKISKLAIPPITHGPLSCLYSLRKYPSLTPGSSVFLNVHHDKKNYHVEVKVEAIEPLSGPWGEVETIRVLVVMPFRGIFLNKGNIRIWMTNDLNRMPMKMKAKMTIGSVEAVLQGWPHQPGG